MTAPASPADPRSFLKALGSRPHPSLVQAAQFTLCRLETDLSTKLASLPPSSDQAKEEAKLREEAENAKLPYKSIVSLFELHQIYEGLMNTTDERTRKTLEVLNSFSDRSHAVDPESGHDVAKTMLEAAHKQSSKIDHDAAKTMLEAAQKQSAKIDLSGRLLRSVPTSFGHKLSNLVSLDLSKNELKDLPSSIGDLDNLEVLDLQSNQLSSLPDAIGFLENLKVLNVSGNMLAALPESLGGCRKMVELNAGFNQLERLLARLGYDLCLLENLCLHSNKLTFLPASICELKHLKFLDLHFNKIKSLPASLGNMSALEKLNISNNFSDFGGTLPDTIGDLVFLVELDVSFNQIRVLPDSVGALENLKVLKVEHNPLVIPPPEVIEHSLEALLEYMSMRWKTSQTFGEEICSSPRSNGLKVGFRAACAGMGGSSLVHWLAGRCSGRNAVPLTLQHKQLSGYRS